MISTKNESSSGFFKDLHVKFRATLSDKEMKDFTNLTSDDDRFHFALKKNSKDQTLYEVQLKSSKDPAKALELKEQGNKAFQASLYVKAIHYYNRSLLFFPPDEDCSKDLAVTRANRSAALYHIERFREALRDIEAAVSSGYPKDLLYKVKDRKARCLMALKQNKSAQKAFQETLTALDDSKLKTDSKQKWQKDVQIMLAMMAKVQPKDEKIPKSGAQDEASYKRNPVYTAASDAVGIKSGEVEGRYAVAARDVDIGEVLVSEEPHCAVLLQEYSQTNCFHCFTRVEVGEPCTGCSKVIFCSVKCQREAWRTHHRVECKTLEALWSSGLSITCLMALRIIAQKPLRYFQDQKLKDRSIASDGSEYKGSDYATVYSLVRHENRRNVEDLLHRANIAVFLFQCLKAGQYFAEESSDENERLIGGLLLRHLQILQFNAHEVSELRVQGNAFTNSVSTFVGAAVFPTLALFNHSCNPSITRYFNGTKVVARAIKSIRKGENISENYGPMFTLTGREERRATLESQYWFSCECEACTGDWPTAPEMDITTLPFRCSNTDCGAVVKVPLTTMNCVVACIKCGKSNNLMKGLKVLQDTENVFRLGKAYLDEGDPENALKKFMELYKLIDEVLVPPFKDYHLCQQAIRTCFLTRGNIFRYGMQQ